MSEDFDPYYRWLGIAPKDQPANHYRLLGLDLFEPNLEVIRDAAERQIAHVRTYQLGAHGVLAQKVLNELGAAKGCLLDRAAKQAYDEQLRGRLGGAARVAPPPLAPPLVPPLAPPLAEPPIPEMRARRMRRRTLPLVSFAAIVVGCGFVGGVLLWLHRAERPTGDEQGASLTVPAPSPPSAAPPAGAPSGTPPAPSTTQVEDAPDDAAGPEIQPTVAPPPASIRNALNDARRAMADRKLQDAQEILARATAAPVPSGEQPELERASEVLGLLITFFGGPKSQLPTVRAGEELDLGATRVIVSEATKDRLLLFSQGRYVEFPADRLPSQIVVALAERQLANLPNKELCVAAFLAVDRGGDRQEARRRLAALGDAGRAVAAEMALAPPATAAPAMPAVLAAPAESGMPAAPPLMHDVVLPADRTLRAGSFAFDLAPWMSWFQEHYATADSPVVALQYPNGSRAFACHKFGVLDGVTVGVSPTGAPFVHAAYDQGRRQGVFRAWDEAGLPRYWCNYVKGKRNDLCCYFEKGLLRLVLEYAFDKVLAVHLVESWKVVQSLPDADVAGRDAHVAPLLGRCRQLESQLEEDEDRFRKAVREEDLAIRRKRQEKRSPEVQKRMQQRMDDRAREINDMFHRLRQRSGL